MTPTGPPSPYDADTYGESFADVYDDWYDDVSDVSATVAAIVELSASGTVLELGVGTGRIALPLADAGVSVVGVDASTAMLAAMATKSGAESVTAIHADMAHLLEGNTGKEIRRLGPYSVVFAAFNTFFNLVTEAGQHACLRAVREILTADGVLVIEGFVPPDDGLANGGVSVKEITPDAAILSASKHDADTQTIWGQHIEIRAEGNRLRPWMLRYLDPDQLDAAAATQGLSLSQRWADWSRRPFEPGRCETHVSLYSLAEL